MPFTGLPLSLYSQLNLSVGCLSPNKECQLSRHSDFAASNQQTILRALRAPCRNTATDALTDGRADVEGETQNYKIVTYRATEEDDEGASRWQRAPSLHLRANLPVGCGLWALWPSLMARLSEMAPSSVRLRRSLIVSLSIDY